MFHTLNPPAACIEKKKTALFKIRYKIDINIDIIFGNVWNMLQMEKRCQC